MRKRPNFSRFDARGVTAELCKNISERWLKGIAETNPAILTMFRDRDAKPYRDLLAWSGEFAGKYLTSAYFVYLETGDEALKEYVVGFIDRLLARQDEDGYLGCYSRETRFTGSLPQTPDKRPWTWDCWAHYHIMYGLLLWNEETGNERYFKAVERMAALLMNTFYNGKKNIVSTGCSEMNLAVYHVFGRLYNRTGKEEYLAFARAAEADMGSGESGDWLEWAARGGRFCDCRKPRWESLHVVMGFAEMYKGTGERKYLAALKATVESILETDVHNTGGFSTGEQAIGTPYQNGVVETCCVVAFDALVLELYRLTGELSLVDFLETAHYNAAMGAVSPSGAWATYDTPMEGEKLANFHGCDFQSRPGAPMLNCCSVNFPRGVAEMAEWAVTEDEKGIYINNFEPCRLVWAGGEIAISGEYPFGNQVKISCRAERETRGIFVRVPSWSKRTSLRLNGKESETGAGVYVRIPNAGDAEICFDFSARFIAGKEAYAGKYSVYQGPILFAYDLSLNRAFSRLNGGTGFTTAERLAEMRVPALRFSDFENAEMIRGEGGRAEMRLPSGVVLCDFYRAGADGGLYKTWLEIE